MEQPSSGLNKCMYILLVLPFYEELCGGCFTEMESVLLNNCIKVNFIFFGLFCKTKHCIKI